VIGHCSITQTMYTAQHYCDITNQPTSQEPYTVAWLGLFDPHAKLTDGPVISMRYVTFYKTVTNRLGFWNKAVYANLVSCFNLSWRCLNLPECWVAFEHQKIFWRACKSWNSSTYNFLQSSATSCLSVPYIQCSTLYRITSACVLPWTWWNFTPTQNNRQNNN